tara:strand:- start:341 stop:538 length:198 start_codon:yes stop_codon:yes gene_type:complete
MTILVVEPLPTIGFNLQLHTTHQQLLQSVPASTQTPTLRFGGILFFLRCFNNSNFFSSNYSFNFN